jgi:hypothetical protein
MSRGWSIVVPEGYVVSRWRVGAPIASGSWASVYEARLAEPEDAPSGRPPGPEVVAVKFLPTGTVTQRQLAVLADMARREQEAYRRLRHPRLVQLFDAVVIEDRENPELDGAVALVTERARTSLSAVAARAAGEAVADAPRIITEICEGLAYMHSVGWVHGDLKPGNVLVMADGSACLADFGLAAELDGTHGYLPPAGTCDYQPPERWDEPLTDRGLAVRESADIWDHARRSEWTAARLLERLRGLQAATAAASPARRRRRRARLAAIAALPLAAALAGTGTSLWLNARPPADSAQYLRAGSGIPARYEPMIVAAGTMCRAPGVSPALVAAILKARSDFNPNKSNQATDAYGIAGWSLSLLPHYTDRGGQYHALRYALTPTIAIAALGRYLCQLAPTLASVPGDPAVNLAAAYRTSGSLVRHDHGVPPPAHWLAEQVSLYLQQYQPASG